MGWLCGTRRARLHVHRCQPITTTPPPCASTLKVRKTTVRRVPVLRQGRACAKGRGGHLVRGSCSIPTGALEQWNTHTHPFGGGGGREGKGKGKGNCSVPSRIRVCSLDKGVAYTTGWGGGGGYEL